VKKRLEARYRAATLFLTILLGSCFLPVVDQAAPKQDSSPQDEPASSATIQGIVIDAKTGRPIAGAGVSLERGRVAGNLNERGKKPAASAVSNERGRFRFERIEPGAYTIMAAKPGYLLLSFYAVELEPGGTATREIRLEPLVKFSGRVLDESNSPIKEVRIRALFDSRQASLALRRFLSEQGDSRLTTTSGRQGEFDLLLPAEGESVTLAALAPGYAPARLGPLHVRAGRAQAGILLRLSRGLEAQGRVVDENRTPIYNATITAHRSGIVEDGLGLEGLEPLARSGADGRFVLRGLEKGIYALKVSHSGHATSMVPEVEIKPRTANRLPDIVLTAEAQIKGRVIDAEDQPIPGARISGVSGEVNSSEAISDDKGAFVLRGFAPDASVSLSATAAGHNDATKSVRAPDRDVVIVLLRNGILRGRVEDAETLAPIKEFQIRVIYSAERKSFRSEEGAFEWKGLAPGRWTLIAQAQGYQEAEVADIEIRAGEATQDVVFSLTRGVELSGRVVDAATGARLSNVTVTYRLPTGVELPPLAFDWNGQTTDSDGGFKFEGLPRGKITIIAESPLHAQARRTAAAGKEKFIEIRLPKGGSISGRVVGVDSTTPISGAQVSLWATATMSAVTIPADETGAFSFTGLAAGRYQLTAEASLGHTNTQEIVLRESEPLTGLVLTVKAGATIRGQVTGLRPDEPKVVEIVAQGQGGFLGAASTNSDGSYAIHGVPGGPVKVMAQTYSQRIVSRSIEIPEGAQELTLNIEFPRVARLSGRVTRGGKPVAARIVSASPRSADSAAGSEKTDHNGMYVIDGLSEDDYVIGLAKEWTKSVRVSGDTVLDIELPALSVSGRVVEANSGQPLSGVTVQVRSFSSTGDAGVSRTNITDSLGRFSVEGVEPGEYQIVAHKSGFKVCSELLSIPAPSEPVLSLTPAEGITIRVRDGISGLALRAVAVDAFSGAQPLRLNITLDETGSGELPQLNPGHYNLFISSRGYAPKTVIGWTVPGSALNLFLTPGGRLEINVDPAHTGARATLVDANGVAFHPAQAEFALVQPTVFPHLAPGEYTLVVRLSNETKKYKASITEGETTVVQVK
jgi:hypothetical protein